jgi:hypothetical protein
MIYTYWRWDTGIDRVYRSAPGGFYWVWRAGEWVDLPFPNSVSDYIYGEGGAGIVKATEAEVMQIIEAALEAMRRAKPHVCQCGDRFAERRLLEAHLSVADLMRGHHAAVPNPDPAVQEG